MKLLTAAVLLVAWWLPSASGQTSAGQVTILPADVTVIEGNDAEFTCSPLFNIALPVLQIRPDGVSAFQNIELSDPRVSFEDSGNGRTYTYSNLQLDEDGTQFTCLVGGITAPTPVTITVIRCAGMLGGIGCDASGQSCTYTASYAVQQDDSITFTVSATTTGWVALGVSDDQLMPDTDVVLGASDGTNTLIEDRFATQRAEPPVDASQDITSASASHVNGVTTISFNRPRDSGDSNDISLDVCRFFLFAFNGPINFATGSAGYHGLGTMFRAPSAERICIPTSAQCFAGAGTGGMGGDPHYSVLLPSGQLLCFSVQGETGFSFNLISNKLMHMNALFVQDSVRDEVTWIGSLGIVVRNTPYKKSDVTKLRFVVEEKKIYIGEEVALQVQKIEKLTFSNGKLMINESSRTKGEKSPEVYVDLQDVGLSFKVRFTKSKHLDLSWERVAKQPADSHGMIGQFFRNGIEIDELRKLLLLPTMDPVPVMRKPVWHFMERETPEDQFCWAAMNPGYQGKRLIEGHYLDYLVTDILSGNFKFKAKDRKL